MEASTRHGICMILVTLVFGILCFFNGLAASSLGISTGIFTQSTGNVSDKYETQVTPSGWIFTIWGIIYTWQVLWILYGLSSWCRKGVDNLPLNVSPCLIPTPLMLFYIINNFLNVAWLILWDREEMVAALVVILLLVITLIICLVISHIRLEKYMFILSKNNMMKEIWLIRILLQNGLAIYATWTTIASLINLAVVLQYWSGSSSSLAGTVSLSVLAVLLIVWFFLDMVPFDKYTRYNITPYIVVCLALGGILDKQWTGDATENDVITCVLLGIALLIFVIKVVAVAIRHRGNQNMIV